MVFRFSESMVDYYYQLFETAEKRKTKIDNHIRKIKSFHMDQNVKEKGRSKRQTGTSDISGNNNSVDKDNDKNEAIQNLAETSNSSTESFYSVSDVPSQVDSELNVKLQEMHSSESMDIINANEIADKDENSNKPVEIIQEPNLRDANIQQAIDNFELARKIKHKVMTEEMGIDYGPRREIKPTDNLTLAILTEAQKNKLKILSSEFDIPIKPDNIRTDRLTNASIINRNKVMGISDCFQYSQLDNENFINKNIRNAEIINRGGTIKKSKSLSLDFDKLSVKSHKMELEKPIPMSVDSTPLSDLPHSTVTTPSTMFLSIDTNQVESIPDTAETQQTDEGFTFGMPKNDIVFPIYLNRKESSFEKSVFSKRVTTEEATGISTNCLKLFLYESVHIPLVAQMKLVSNELLRYFIDDLRYLRHLESLRDYFFLQDGEFGRNITENLFAKLYDANFPRELINCRTLQDVVFGAMDMSNKDRGNSHCLSFKINSLPKCFDLGNPDVLDCLSLTYKVNWPLNILLPTDTVAKYDEVFKYLLKLNRVSWALKKIFLVREQISVLNYTIFL